MPMAQSPQSVESHSECSTQSVCWTCKLQAIDCDGSYPICGTCIASSSVCEGYDQDLDYLDHSDHRRRRLAVIKEILHRRRRQRGRKKSTAESKDLTIYPSPALSQPQHKSRESLSRAWPRTNSHVSLDSWENDDAPGSASTSGLDGDMLPSHTFDGTISNDFDQFIDPLSGSYSPLISPELPWNLQTSFDNDPFGEKETQHRFEEIRKSPTPWETVSPKGSSPKPDSLHQADLLLHYFDRASSIQSLVHRGSKSQRGWLYLLINRSEASLFSTLSFAAEHLSLESKTQSHESETEATDETTEYSKDALEKLHSLMDTFKGRTPLHKEHQVDILLSIYQLLTLEMLRSDFDSWNNHMATIASILGSPPSLLSHGNNARNKTTTVGPTSTLLPSGPSEQVSQIALDVLVHAYLRADILSCAFLRQPNHLLDYHYLLTKEPFTSTDGWHFHGRSLLGLSRVSQLDLWKKQKLKEKRLSTIEMMNKGSNIEKYLETILQDDKVSSALSSSQGHGMDVELTVNQEDAITTSLLTNATLIYLYVVLSGAYPDLTEISDRVERCLQLLRLLKHSKLMHSTLLHQTIWPLLIAGCMATELNQWPFRDLIQTLSMTSPISPIISRTYVLILDVMVQCWTSRKDSPSAEVDWTSAMDSLGQRCWFV